MLKASVIDTIYLQNVSLGNNGTINGATCLISWEVIFFLVSFVFGALFKGIVLQNICFLKSGHNGIIEFWNADFAPQNHGDIVFRDQKSNAIFLNLASSEIYLDNFSTPPLYQKFM